MTNASKVQKLAITAFVAVVMAFLFLNLFTVQAHAAGLLDETIDTAHEFSKYPIDNYQLDFYVDSSWDWLPWNWLDGIGKTAQYAIYLFTNFLWTLNLYISNAVGYLIQQAYDLDFISSAASEIGKNIQLIAGVSAGGCHAAGWRVLHLCWFNQTRNDESVSCGAEFRRCVCGVGWTDCLCAVRDYRRQRVFERHQQWDCRCERKNPCAGRGR